MDYVVEVLDKIPPIPLYESEISIDEEEQIDYTQYDVNIEDGVYEIYGPFVDRLIAGVNFGDDESVNYFHRSIKKRGIIEKLEEHGIQEGDTVKFGDIEFDFVY